MTIERTATGSRYVEILRGDTLQRIAARELGDASRWPELVGFNRLVPPFIVDDAASAGERVLAAGQFIRIPATDVVVSATSSPDEVYGRDVGLRLGRIEAIDGDFAIVGGLDNLRQALRHRIETDSGELLFHPGYGSQIRRILGQASGPAATLLAAQLARTAVLADERIASVPSAEAEAEGDMLRVTVKAEPVVGKVVDITSTL